MSPRSIGRTPRGRARGRGRARAIEAASLSRASHTNERCLRKRPNRRPPRPPRLWPAVRRRPRCVRDETRNRCDRASRGDPNEDASGRCRYGRCARRTRGGREEDARANDQNGFVRARAFGRWRRGMDANASREGTSRRIPALGCASVDELGD